MGKYILLLIDIILTICVSLPVGVLSYYFHILKYYAVPAWNFGEQTAAMRMGKILDVSNSFLKKIND